jgi:ABC-type Fe2+-enterobactin transport system substrate-binding protein
MATAVIDILTEFTGKKAFKQAETATEKLSKNVKNLARNLGFAFGTAAVINYAKASVRAAADDQKAQTQLALALKNVGLEIGRAHV